MRVFVAGASGAIGEPLIAELLQRGHSVVGMTTSEAGAKNLARQGAEPVIADALDAAAVEAALRRSKAEVVIDELTSLPKEQSDMPKYAAGDRRLRIEGGGNLLRAAIAGGVRRYLQQSSGFFLKAAVGRLADESSPFDVNASPSVAASARTYTEVEARLFSSTAMEGVALRYGFFYGPKTWYYPGEAAANMVMRQQNPVVGKGEGVSSFVHIDDAAIATVAALTAEAGVYNLVDDDPSPQIEWLPAFARFVGAPEPPRMSETEVTAIAGEDVVYYATKLSGASNAKTKRVLRWKPRRLEWLSFSPKENHTSRSSSGHSNWETALKHKLTLVVISAMLGALLQGCAAGKPPSQQETSLANAAKDVTIPLQAGKMKNPLPDTDEVVSQGQEVFLGSCAQCHGADARGDTNVGRNMDPPAMDLSSPHVQHWSDAELFWIIQNGVRLTGMPSWKSSISDNDIWKLARFIHKLPRLDAASASTAVPSHAQAAISTQDKYALKIPNGLAFAEFRGYESWQVISISHNGSAVAAILGNPVMINAYKTGIPGNGKPFPDGAKMAKVHWNAKVNVGEPGGPTVPGPQHDVDLMVKDSKRFADSGEWGYGVFEYDAASGTFRLGNLKDKPPQGNDAKCGFSCHTIVKTRDYVFTDYGHR